MVVIIGIGYQGKSDLEVLAELRQAGVRLVVDVHRAGAAAHPVAADLDVADRPRVLGDLDGRVVRTGDRVVDEPDPRAGRDLDGVAVGSMA